MSYDTEDLDLHQYFLCGNEFPFLKGNAPSHGPVLDKIRSIKMLRDTFKMGQSILPTLEVPGLAISKWTVEKRFFPYEGINPGVPEAEVKKWCAGVVAHSILWQLQIEKSKS